MPTDIKTRVIDLKQNAKKFTKIDQSSYTDAANIRGKINACIFDTQDSKYKFELASKEKINCMCPVCCKGFLEKAVYWCVNEKNSNDKVKLELTTCTNFEHCDFVTHENVESKLSYKLIDEFINRSKKGKETKEKNAELKLKEAMDESSLWSVVKQSFKSNPVKLPITLAGTFLILMISVVFVYNAFTGDVSQLLKAKFGGAEIEYSSSSVIPSAVEES
jgi:hypothetical protein